MKNAYLVVTDLHIDFAKANRLNYFAEVVDAMNSILSVATKYREMGCEVKLLLLGDVFDGSISNPSDAMQAVELVRYFCANFAGTWSVVGNHEISYAKDNPYWFLVSSLDDPSLSSVRRYIQPRGLSPTVVVPDVLEDGEVKFYFNHYGTSAKTPSGTGVFIGLFHQNVGSNDICKMWGTFDDVEEAAYVQAYNYCFFGHMHLAKGKYYLNSSHTCLAEWLGTIGRTKVTEVSDEDLQVNIPCIRVDDGKFVGIEDNSITLLSEEASIDRARLQASEESKRIVQEHRQISVNTFKGKTLFDSVEGSLEGTPLAFLLSFLDHSWDEVQHSYNETLRHPMSVSDEGTGDTNAT